MDQDVGALFLLVVSYCKSTQIAWIFQLFRQEEKAYPEGTAGHR